MKKRMTTTPAAGLLSPRTEWRPDPLLPIPTDDTKTKTITMMKSHRGQPPLSRDTLPTLRTVILRKEWRRTINWTILRAMSLAVLGRRGEGRIGRPGRWRRWSRLKRGRGSRQGGSQIGKNFCFYKQATKHQNISPLLTNILKSLVT